MTRPHSFPFVHGLGAAVLALSIVACGQQDATAPSAGPAPADATPAEPPTPVAPDADASDEAGPTGFDIARLPVSRVPLGEFPYFSVPEGYRADPLHTKRLNFGEAAFWVGDRFERVEGKVYATGIRADRDSGKQFSAPEVARNLQHVIEAAGGVEVASGEIPRASRQDEAIETLMRQYHTEARCWDDDPVQTFVIRREAANIWVRTCKSQRFAGLVVLEEEAFVATSRLLPADELKRQLDAAGRVAVTVNFATDKADILPESTPQVEQVLRLLEEDASLELSINGHTDDTGGAAHNQSLSEARARSLVDALVAGGIDAARLQARGFGQSQPVADNSTETGRAQNRRVELVKRG
ncbi:OmpA family protein [Marilutibacter aestuarii]|nr:OmpA family protein [Lysobacter aestuarii]